MGYGGTKTEMERLLADATKLTGVKYDITNLGDVYDAIHVIQGDLGLTGVAAQEASETFSGSFNAMKASAQNVMGSLALGENVQPALQGLITAADTFFFNNFIPMLGTIAKSIPGAIATIIVDGVPLLLNRISTAVSNLATSLTSKANGITAGKVKAWAQATIPKLLSSAGNLLGNFARGLVNNLPKIASAIGRIGLSIVRGLGSALWGKITTAANGIKEKFLAPINALKEKVKGIIDKIKGFFSFSVKTPHIPKPSFSISPPGWKLGDLLKGSIPKLGISWNKEGFITKGATLIGAGEDGAEALLPLRPFWKKMDEIANGAGGGVTINVYASQGMNVNELADEIQRRIITAQKRRTSAWA